MVYCLTLYGMKCRYNSNLGIHRQRFMSSQGYRGAPWCIVTAAGSRNGNFMECHRCYNLYGLSARR